MPSMKFKALELDKLLKVDPKSAMIMKLRTADTDHVDVDSSTVDRVKLVTKEVLKACNVIRPSMGDLI